MIDKLNIKLVILDGPRPYMKPEPPILVMRPGKPATVPTPWISIIIAATLIGAIVMPSPKPARWRDFLTPGEVATLATIDQAEAATAKLLEMRRLIREAAIKRAKDAGK